MSVNKMPVNPMHVDELSVSKCFLTERYGTTHRQCSFIIIVDRIVNFNFDTGMVFQPAVIKLFKSVIYNFRERERVSL